jgi:hypothetical protein
MLIYAYRASLFCINPDDDPNNFLLSPRFVIYQVC